MSKLHISVSALVANGFALPKSVLKGMQIWSKKKDNKIPIDKNEYDDSDVDSEEDKEVIYDEEYPEDDPDVQDINWF